MQSWWLAPDPENRGREEQWFAPPGACGTPPGRRPVAAESNRVELGS